MPEYLTVAQVANLFHVGEDCVRGWLKQGKLQKTKAGGRTLIERTAIDLFVRSSAKPEMAEVDQ